MKLIPIYLIVALLIAITFGVWGLLSNANQIQYSDAYGPLPFWGGLGSIFLLAISAILLVIHMRKK
mgnify:CR=1 FL=1|tara:strand:- start:340 stop:537 length:198 start_codon:yes stop_codon:yes gene_type:complete